MARNGVHVRVVYDRTETMKRRLETGSTKFERRACREIGDEIRERLLPGSRGGHKYPRLPRRSSAPGEAPQYQFGDLFRSIRTVKGTSIGHSVVISDEKARWMEFGTRHMAPRPSIRPSIRAVEARIEHIARAEIDLGP